MDPYLSDQTANHFYHASNSAHSGTGQRLNISPSREQRSYTAFPNQFTARGVPYPFYAGLPGTYPPHHKSGDQRVGTQYQSSCSSRPPDLLSISHSVEVTRAGPPQSLSSIVAPPTSQTITSHRIVDHAEPGTSDTSSSSSRNVPVARPTCKSRSGPLRGSPRGTPSLIKAEAPTTLGATMGGSNCFSTAEEPVPYALTNHPIFSEDLKKACTPIRKVENPFATQKKSPSVQSVHGEYEIERYKNDITANNYAQSQVSRSKLGVQTFPNGVQDLSVNRNQYSGGHSSSHVPDRQGGALDLSIKSVRQSPDSSALELNSSFRSSAPYLSKEQQFAIAKRNMPYDYSHTQPPAKRQADAFDLNASRNKYIKISPPNHVLPRQMDVSRNSQATAAFSRNKVTEQCDLRPAYDSSTFAQAHNSLTMPYGRQAQSANSSGYFSEGISESGVSFTPPVSPRIKPSLRMQDKDRTELEPYFPQVRPSCKNSPYNAYSGQYSSVYDRVKVDETLKFNSQNSYTNSIQDYYSGFSVDRYPAGGHAADNSPAFQSSVASYPKTSEASNLAHRSYDHYFKNTHPAHRFTDPKPVYQPYKSEANTRIEPKREPKIEIASQPINLVEDNEISIEKTKNETVHSDNFGYKEGFEINSFQTKPQTMELKAIEKGSVDLVSNKTNTPNNKISTTERLTAQPTTLGNTTDESPNALLDCKSSAAENNTQSCQKPHLCIVAIGCNPKLVTNLEACNQTDFKVESEISKNCNDSQNISDQRDNREITDDKITLSDNSHFIDRKTDLGTVPNSNIRKISVQDSGPIETKLTKELQINSNILEEISKENVPCTMPKEVEMISNVKQENEVKLEPGLNEYYRTDYPNTKKTEQEGSSKIKVNFADVNSLKEHSPPKTFTQLVTKKDKNYVIKAVANSSGSDSSNLKFRKSDAIQPILNLSLSSNQASPSHQSTEDIAPKPNSFPVQTFEGYNATDKMYPKQSVRSYYDAKSQPVPNIQQNMSYPQRSHNQSVSNYSQINETEKVSTTHSAYQLDSKACHLKQGINSNNKNLYSQQSVAKAENYGVLPKSNVTKPYGGYELSKHANIDAGDIDVSSKSFYRDAKDVIISHTKADTLSNKSTFSKQIPLAINPRVLSPWNSSIPHSLPANTRKPAASVTSQLTNDFQRETSPFVKEIAESEKKLRITPISTYPHSAYGSQYPYQPTEANQISQFSGNTQTERPQSYNFDSKSATYIHPTRPYSTESHSYKPYQSATSLGNIASASHQFNSSSSMTDRPLLSPHSPPHPPPPRLEASHHQSLYYPSTFNANISPRTMAEQYARASPQFPVAGDAKYHSREYSPYTYKGSYGHQTGLDSNSYHNPSPYYAHQPYNVASSQRASEPHGFSKPATYDYSAEQQAHSKIGPESSYLHQEMSTYINKIGYSYPHGSAGKEHSSDRSPSLPPAAHLPQTSAEYRLSSYDNFPSVHASSQSNAPFSKQCSEQMGYLQSNKANNQSNQFPGSNPYTMRKSYSEGFEGKFDSVTRTECDGAQYSMPYRRPAATAVMKSQDISHQQELIRETAVIKSQDKSHQQEIIRETTSVPSDVKSKAVDCLMASKNSAKTISNPVQPLYSSWANYRAPLPDVLNKHILKPQSFDSLQNAPQKYPSFKTNKELINQHAKACSSSGTFFSKIRQAASSNNNKGSGLKEHVPFSRQEHNLKGMIPSRAHLKTEPGQDIISKGSITSPLEKPNSTESEFDEVMNVFLADLNINKEDITSKKSVILAKRYANKVELQHAANTSAVIEEESLEETESEPEPPCKFRGKFKSIKDKKVERLILTYASHSDDSATEMIADEDESDFEEELVREIREKARKGRGKDKRKMFKLIDDSDASSADRSMRSSKRKKELSRQHRKDTSSNNSTDTSSDSSEDSNSSEDISESGSRLKIKVPDDSTSDGDTRKRRNTRSKIQDSKKIKTDTREHSKIVTRRRMLRDLQDFSELSDEEVKPKRLRSSLKNYSSDSENNDNDTISSSTDCDSRIGKEKTKGMVGESDSEEDSRSNLSTPNDATNEESSMDDPILKKLERQRKLESNRPDVIEMKAWKQKTREQAVALLKSLPLIPMKHSWRRPSFSGVFKKGWQTELRRFKLKTARTPKQLVSIPATPGNTDRRRGRSTRKGATAGQGQSNNSKDGLYSKAMMRRFFDKVLMIDSKDDESLSRSSSSPFSTFTPTGLTPTPSVTPSMLVTGIGSRDSDKDSLISLRGTSPAASDSATLRRRSIATTIMLKIQRQQCKGRSLSSSWLRKPRSVIKSRSKSALLPLPKSLSSDGKFKSEGKKSLVGTCLRSIFGGDPPLNLRQSSEKLLSKSSKRKKYFSAISSSTHSTSSTPSTPVGTDEVSGIVASRKRKMKKFRSGFDYIPRKKKKVKPLEEMASRVRKKVATRRRRVWPKSSRDVALEVKTWVINKGLGETALHRAARLQYHDVVIYCLESKEINVNARDNAGYTPLHEACNRGHLDVAQALCAFGAHVNAPGYGGMRPLHEACDNGHVELVRLLLSFGADINLGSYAGQSCLSLASDSQCGQFVLDFTNDLRGKKVRPWTFNGPARLFDLEEQGADFFISVPPEKETLGEDFIFEASETLLPELYIIKGFAGSFVLLNELLDNLNTSYNDLIKEAGMIETVMVSKKDFKKMSHCRSCPGSNEYSSKCNGEVVLVRYTKRLQNLLGVEVVTVT